MKFCNYAAIIIAIFLCCPQVQISETLNVFSFNLILWNSTELCQYSPVSVKICELSSSLMFTRYSLSEECLLIMS
jgi:hypothetical protein